MMHPDGTIDAEPCVICGELTLSILGMAVYGDAARIAAVPEGTVIREAFICRPCQGEEVAKTDAFRKEFERLLSMGASRKAANRIMCKRIDQATGGGR